MGYVIGDQVGIYMDGFGVLVGEVLDMNLDAVKVHILPSMYFPDWEIEIEHEFVFVL
jgi:hypothetical protein